ncbi:hypothetical protein BV898_02465 [Hypsibius exemplaris]|uniref:Uncharacterized protein n=1 Tax=Hypsibius exemplaris TaxID=2072580 RepID=A0A1W0X8K5_HYPEX|nr:hypothetical protein BV898_02465 [Hypsibius exemplaris]
MATRSSLSTGPIDPNGEEIEMVEPTALRITSQAVPLNKLQAAVRNNQVLRLRLQQQDQAQNQDRQNKSQSAALPFVTTGVLNCTLIANNVDDLADFDKVIEWDTRAVMLLLTIVFLLLVQFAIVGVLSYLFYLGSAATSIAEDFSEAAVDKVAFEKESRRLRRIRNLLHAIMLVLALNASVFEVIYLTLSKEIV